MVCEGESGNREMNKNDIGWGRVGRGGVKEENKGIWKVCEIVGCLE